MTHSKNESEITPDQKTVARFFTEKRQIAWVLLGMTMLWGVYGYFMMPKRKDPEYAQRYAVTICPWPGSSAERIEQLVTRKIEEKIAQNARVEKIESVSRTGRRRAGAVLKGFW
jgi:multidrug efflux pump subunit AcrB